MERSGMASARPGAPFATRFGPPAPDLADRVLALEREVARLSALLPDDSDGEEAADVR